jgi:hypothetical protein
MHELTVHDLTVHLAERIVHADGGQLTVASGSAHDTTCTATRPRD